jgi:hypothetical protein
MDALNMLDNDDIDRAVAQMSNEEKAYFKLLISHLVRSFSDPDYSCVMVVGLNSRGTVSVCSVNASEEHSSEMLAHSCDVMSFADTVGAPAKGEFH